MSRSNPNENGTPNPSVRWFEWNGEQGVIRYYDKEQKKNVDVGSDFTFLLLDRLGKVGGWHDASQSAIYSNEVKDTRQDTMVVRAFKGGTLIEGIYRDIKDRVSTLGGYFVANCYIAFKHEGSLAIGALQFKGAALGSWMEFEKQHRKDLYSKAIKISGSTEGKKGRITYRMPVLKITDLSPETNALAVALDQELQTFLKSYFARTKRDQADTPHVSDHEMADNTPDFDDSHVPVTELPEDDIPFAWLLPLALPLSGLVAGASMFV